MLGVEGIVDAERAGEETVDERFPLVELGAHVFQLPFLPGDFALQRKEFRVVLRGGGGGQAEQKEGGRFGWRRPGRARERSLAETMTG